LGPRHLAIRIPAGQPLLASELISNTAPGAIDYSPLLNAGEVAEAVQVQPVAADNAGIQPSDHVDMLLSLKFDLTKDAAARHAFINSNGTTLTDQTSKFTIVGNLWETQTTLQNLRVLNSAANVYTLAMSHQDAQLLKWVKDDNGTIDLVVRAADDSGKLPKIFETTAVLPEYIVRDRHVKNHFVLP
jgi:Flp pilus assembly protein CpaB